MSYASSIEDDEDPDIPIGHGFEAIFYGLHSMHGLYHLDDDKDSRFFTFVILLCVSLCLVMDHLSSFHSVNNQFFG